MVNNLIKCALGVCVAGIAVGCIGYEAGRLTVADEDWAVDTRISESGQLQYIFISGKVDTKWPEIEVETGTTPDNRPFVLITAKD